MLKGDLADEEASVAFEDKCYVESYDSKWILGLDQRVVSLKNSHIDSSAHALTIAVHLISTSSLGLGKARTSTVGLAGAAVRSGQTLFHSGFFPE